MTVYNKKTECCGCRACEQSCPVGSIQMISDEEGFIYPVIDERTCINCGICHQVCEGLDNRKQDNAHQSKFKTYAVKNKDNQIRKASSSGGVFYELAREITSRKGVVFGAIFDAEFKVFHPGTSVCETLNAMCQSKYVQSDTRVTYREVQDLLEKGKWILYSGTPCQIAGLKSFLKEEYEKLICVSVICHGVPSPVVWSKYLAMKQETHAMEELESIEFRNKANGWKDFLLTMTFASGHMEQTLFHEDLYMQGFLQNLYLRPSCYACRVKGNNQNTDIILGDYWGIEAYHSEFHDNQGVSAVIIHSNKGVELWHAVKDRFNVIDTEYDFIKAGNSTLIESVPENSGRNKFFYEMTTGKSIKDCIADNLKKPIDDKETYWYKYPTLLKYLYNKLQGYEVSQFFLKMNWKKIALYAINDLTELLYLDLAKGEQDIKIACICDKYYEAFANGYKGNPVIGIDELVRRYKHGEIDCIVIGSVIHENSIIRELMLKGCDMERILSINSVIYGCGS